MSRITVTAGRRYREVTLHAADTRAAARHISAERPVSYATQQAVRREATR